MAYTKRNVRYPSDLRYDDDGWIVTREAAVDDPDLGDDDLAFLQTETLADLLIAGLEQADRGPASPSLDRLRALDAEAAALRVALGLDAVEAPITWFQDQQGGKWCYEVRADGYGGFTLRKTEWGVNPLDATVAEQAHYVDEISAEDAARRLAEEGVDWGDRDDDANEEGDDHAL